MHFRENRLIFLGIWGEAELFLEIWGVLRHKAGQDERGEIL